MDLEAPVCVEEDGYGPGICVGEVACGDVWSEAGERVALQDYSRSGGCSWCVVIFKSSGAFKLHGAREAFEDIGRDHVGFAGEGLECGPL